MKRLLSGLAAAAVLSATTVSASKSTDPSTIVLNPPAGTYTSWEPRLGDDVTFTVTYPKTLDHYGVRIQILCYDGAGNLIYGEAGPYTQAFLLGGAMSIWYQTGGPAHCRADLYYWSYNGGQKWNGLAYTTFDALGR